jgi:membrane protein DedA with SNARE-associated domain
MQHLIATYGYVAVFVLMVAESACLPVPSELIMTFAGALAAGAVPGTSLNLVAVIVAGVAGNVAGSYLAWAAGRYGGQPALQRWGHRLWLREHDLDRASIWFARTALTGSQTSRPAVEVACDSPPAIAGTMPPGSVAT